MDPRRPTSAQSLRSRPSSAMHPSSRPPTVPCATPPHPHTKAEKLAKIGMLLHRHGEPDALSHLQASLHLNPTATAVWKTFGHALAQDASTYSAAYAAFRTAAELPRPHGSHEDVAARSGLAAVLTQLGRPGAALDELLKVHRATSNVEDPRVKSRVVAEPMERLCRRLMSSTRWQAVNGNDRTHAWRHAVVAATRQACVLDISTTPLPAMFAAENASTGTRVIRIENLPMSVVEQLLEANQHSRPPPRTTQLALGQSERPPITLVPAAANGLPPTTLESPIDVQGTTRSVILADSDVSDILSSAFLSRLCAARALVGPTPTVVPYQLDVHAMLVQSDDLVRLGAICEAICGDVDLSALNAMAHSTRAVQLSELRHASLSSVCTPLQMNLDGDADPQICGDAECELQVTASGTAHALVVWHTLRLSALHSVDTAPTVRDPAVRQIAHYLWPARQGELDWGTEFAAATESAQAAAGAAAEALAAAAVAQAAAQAAEEAADSAAEAASNAIRDAEEAEKRAAPARLRIQLGAAERLTDQDDIAVADAAATAAEAAPHAANAAKSAAEAVKLAAKAAETEAGSIEEAAERAVEAIEKALDGARVITANMEVLAWSTATKVISAMNEVVAYTSDTVNASRDVEPEGESDDECTDSEASDKGETPEDSGRVHKQRQEEEHRETAGELMEFRAAQAIRQRRRAAIVTASAAADDAATCGAKLSTAISAAVSARAEREAALRQKFEAYGKAVGGTKPIGIPVTSGQTLKLRLRWRTRRVEFQVCETRQPAPAGPPAAASVAVDGGDSTLPDDGAVHLVVSDAEGRVVTATGRAHIAAVKLLVRSGCSFDTPTCGEIKAGTPVRILERRNLTDSKSRTAVRLLLALDDRPFGWVSAVDKWGHATVLREEDPRAKEVLAHLATIDDHLREHRRLSFQNSGTSLHPEPAYENDDESEGEGSDADPGDPPKPVDILLARSAPPAATVRGQNMNTIVAAPLSDYHFPMLADRHRNDAFSQAIARAVARLQPSLVLDIGSGTGLLAVLAARAGARRVLAVEMSPELSQVAVQIAAAHDLSDAVRVLQSHSKELVLGELASSKGIDQGCSAGKTAPGNEADPEWNRRADLLVFEILGTEPLCEGILPVLRDARSRLLQPGAGVIPCALDISVVFVESNDLAKLNSVRGVEQLGFDVSALNSLSLKTRPVRLSALAHTLLTKPTTVLAFDFDGDSAPELEGETEIEIIPVRDGLVDAIVVWFTATLDRATSYMDPVTVTTEPGECEPMRGFSWGQCAHFNLSGTVLREGKPLLLRTRWSDSGVNFTIVGPT